MGYIKHHAIVVTGTYGGWIRKVHEKATEIFDYVSDISPKALNLTESFFIPPDGSKEGWKESDDGDKKRKELISWLDKQIYEDGSSPLRWAELQYGDDDCDKSSLEQGGKMNEKLKKLLAFIKEYEPEIHLPENESEEIVIFLYSFWMDNFEEVIMPCEEPIEFQYVYGFFTCVMNDLIENHCDISIEDFINKLKEQEE